MEDMGTFAPDERTVVSRHFASRTTPFVGNATDTTEIVLRVFV